MAVYDYFAWVGMGTAVVLAVAALIVAGLFAVALWEMFGPKFHCRRPRTHMVVSTYRTDIRDGEGREVKCAPDLELNRIVGISWKLRLFFGLMLFTTPREE